MKENFKKSGFFIITAFITSAIFALFFSDKLLQFINGLSLFAIFTIAYGLFSYLSRDGYFDAMGYSFGKIARKLKNKGSFEELNEEEKTRYDSFYNYKIYQEAMRKKQNYSLLIIGFILLAISIVLSLVFYN
ncbi:MAG: DUF3899 domain-containing protein [Erysipelotrichaceae bacterium]